MAGSAFDQLKATQLLAFIRSGGFPEVAAESAGVPRKLFHRWLARGVGQRAREPYRTFRREVSQAAAQGRLVVEHEIRRKDPKFWLQHGPGRETPECRGWTAAPRAGTYKAGSANLLSPEKVQAMFGEVVTCLSEHPDLRVQLSAKLFQKDLNGKRDTKDM